MSLLSKVALSLIRISLVSVLTAFLLYTIITLIDTQVVNAFNKGRDYEQSLEHCTPPSTDETWVQTQWRTTDQYFALVTCRRPNFVPIVTIVATIAAAFGGVKVALNGTMIRVREIDSKLTQHIKREDEQEILLAGRLGVIETKIDEVRDRIREVK